MADNADNPQYELGIFAGGRWKQWSNAVGQDYYENLSTGATQYAIPAGLEDATTVRNARTGRIRRTDPYPPAPRTYLDKVIIQAHLQLVERTPESREYLYRRVVAAILKHFFPEDEGFDVLQEESRWEEIQGESVADMAVLKVICRPGGSMYTYDYCLIESKKADIGWDEVEDHLSRHCGGTENDSKQVYGIAHIGLHIRFFTADRGILMALSGRLHVKEDVDRVTTMFRAMKNRPLPFI
ncbi:MAG: hypothetical protein M1820_000965 [Bogoriella megaspora]|nr:MAG: hypothetical protein M1820_000965 [Bogoriella megaspora]